MYRCSCASVPASRCRHTFRNANRKLTSIQLRRIWDCYRLHPHILFSVVKDIMFDFKNWGSTFTWEHAYLSSWVFPVLVPVIYLVVVFSLKAYMSNRTAWTLKSTLIVHNVNLCIGSAVMCLGTVYGLNKRYTDDPSDWFFCERDNTKREGQLFFWSYIYYLSKYYELFDTVIVILQKRRLPHFYLHIFHHSAVIPMAYMWVEYKQTLHWGGLIFNTIVHVIMYAYYVFKVLHLPTPWKKYITMTQIIQFFTSFACVAYTTKLILLDDRYCSGLGALGYNLFFNLILFFSFIRVLQINNKSEKKKA